jgi:maltooligosyltrehalose synthase
MVIAIAPRFFTNLVADTTLPTGIETWGDTAVELPMAATASWKSLLTEEFVDTSSQLSVGKLCSQLPIALFSNTAS